MRIGMGLPAAIPGVAAPAVGDWAAAAEHHGFRSVSVIDRLVYDNLNPLVALLFSGLAPAAFTRAARFGEGWVAPSFGFEPPTEGIAAQVAANAHFVARHDAGVADHPWLGRVTRWCLDAIAGLDARPHAYELLFAVRFLDAVADAEPDATPLLDHVDRYLPADGVVQVEGGAEGEAVRALGFAPRPAGAARRLFADDLVIEELRRLREGQRPDGGWTVEFASSSLAAALEWRAYATVQAVALLRAHGLDGSD